MDASNAARQSGEILPVGYGKSPVDIFCSPTCRSRSLATDVNYIQCPQNVDIFKKWTNPKSIVTF